MTNTIEDALLVSRTYRHPRDLVFRAWTEADRLEKWFKPTRDMTVEAKVDLRIGGRFHFTLRFSDGDVYAAGGAYREIERPERLAFSWAWESAPTDTGYESLISLELREVEGGTELSLRHSGLADADAMARHEHGWQGCLESLGEFLNQGDGPMSLPDGPSEPVTAAAMVSQALQLAKMSLSRVKDTFGHVPDDKLAWMPAETSKSAVTILAHLAYCNQYFTYVLRGDPEANRDLAETFAWLKVEEKKITTRAQADELFARTTDGVLKALETLDPCSLKDNPRAAFIMTLVSRHAESHAAQIDYLQTMWGDLEDHFGK